MDDFILNQLVIYNLSQNAIKSIAKEKTAAITRSPILVNNRRYTKIQNWLRNYFMLKICISLQFQDVQGKPLKERS
jgi:hypothetical protein